MIPILQQEVTEFLTSELGRVPTDAEIENGMIAPRILAKIHNNLNVVQSVLSLSSGDNLQKGLNKLALNGGGTLFLRPGRYDCEYELAIADNVFVQGLDAKKTTLTFPKKLKKLPKSDFLQSVVIKVVPQSV